MTEAPTVDLVVLEDALSHELVCCVSDCGQAPDWAVTWSCGHVALYCQRCMFSLRRLLAVGADIWCGTHAVGGLRAVTVVPL